MIKYIQPIISRKQNLYTQKIKKYNLKQSNQDTTGEFTRLEFHLFLHTESLFHNYTSVPQCNEIEPLQVYIYNY